MEIKVTSKTDFEASRARAVLGPAKHEPGVRAVLFDLDGTLYRQGRLRSLMALELSTLPLRGPRKALQLLRVLKAYRDAQEGLRGRPPASPAQAQISAAASASGLSVAEVEGLVDEWMMRRPLKYLQFCRAVGLDGLLGRLDRIGVRTGVFSDYPAHAKLRALGLADRFSPVLCSADPEIGAFKPSPRGFLRACEVWDLTPADVLYVGDRVDVDAAGAAAAGMRCAIIGPSRLASDRSGDFALFPSLERLCRVFDDD